MFNTYKDLIQRLFDNVFHGGDTPLSFTQYLQVIGMGLLLMLLGLLVVAIIVSAFILPKKCLRRLNADIIAQINEEINNPNDDMPKHFATLETLNKKKTYRTIVGVIGLIVLYVPIYIPTVLYILDKVRSLV